MGKGDCEHLEQCLAQGELSGSLSPATAAGHARLIRIRVTASWSFSAQESWLFRWAAGWGAWRALRGGSCRDLWNRDTRAGCQMALF